MNKLNMGIGPACSGLLVAWILIGDTLGLDLGGETVDTSHHAKWPQTSEGDPVTQSQVKARLEELRQEIRRHDALYYNEGVSEISDADYDALFRELQSLEEANPSLATSDSPTQRVGAPLPEGGSFDKVKHVVPMLSIESLRTDEEARDFSAKVVRFLGLEDPAELEWHVEPKFDGVSAALIYRDGELLQGVTRGDGVTGEDITANLRTVRDVPLRLNMDAPPAVLEVRGEVLIARDRFDRFNEWRSERGQPILANARNATAGALRRSDPAEVQKYPLEFHPYSIVRCESVELPGTHSAQVTLLAEWGFAAPAHDDTVVGIEECLDYQQRMEAKRDAIPFEMDGVVAKLNDMALRKRLGTNSRTTKWQYAHKFKPVEATTTLRAIEVQVGVNGRLTPRAHVDPVQVLGVTVRHATLHNEDYVLGLAIKPGDQVFVKRAGDVIPQITGIAKEGAKAVPTGWKKAIPESLKDEDGQVREGAIVQYREDFAMPTHCPSCGAAVVREGKYVRCPNVYGCEPQLIGRTVHMVGRSGFEIDSLGEKMIVQLFDAGFLKSPADLFRLLDRSDEELVALDRWGAKTVDNLKKELREKRKITLGRFLAALSIPEVGTSTARLLAKNFHTLDELQKATPEQLLAVDKIGEEVAGRIRGWFEDERSLALISSLLESGVEIIEEESAVILGSAFEGATVVFTGTLEKMSRFEAKKAVEAQGGRVGSSVSKKTTHLVVGGKPGSKAKKAEELGVTVLLEEEFLQRLSNGGG